MKIKLFLIYLLLACTACEDKDIVLMNELKTLDAKWIRLAEQVSELKQMTSMIDREVKFAVGQLQEISASDSLYADSVIQIQNKLIERSDSVRMALPVWQKSYAFEKQVYDEWYADVPLVKSKADDTRKQIADAAVIINKLSVEAEQMKQSCMDIMYTHNKMREEVIRKVEWIQYDAISLR
jgi:archaellum component FlaC